ncbi:hypothetical protein [Demequina aestuarii]|uniref:hypothetical protein n=1 Tax=Demequina aestuarii TaxID=327095 RepID=UPI000781AADB|nr:hypothetical protein [Demequina aestuarii]
MSATDISPSRADGAAGRAWSVVRMHVANPVPTLVFPWVITLAIFGINVAIWSMVVSAAGGVENLEADAFQYNGGISWIVVFMMITAVQAMNQAFRFALGFSVTRHDFFIGSASYFVLLSLVYSAGLTVIAGVERATDGWGLRAAFFAPWGLVDQPLGTVGLVYLAALLLAFFLGAAVASVWVRWKTYGLYSFFLGVAVVVVGGLWVVTTTNSWADLWSFLTSTSPAALAGWTAPVTVLCGVIGYLFMRRATPRA